MVDEGFLEEVAVGLGLGEWVGQVCARCGQSSPEGRCPTLGSDCSCSSSAVPLAGCETLNELANSPPLVFLIGHKVTVFMIAVRIRGKTY